ncbi:unnamed protein product, partial [Brachionus calyciflorus]
REISPNFKVQFRDEKKNEFSIDKIILQLNNTSFAINLSNYRELGFANNQAILNKNKVLSALTCEILNENNTICKKCYFTLSNPTCIDSSTQSTSTLTLVSTSTFSTTTDLETSTTSTLSVASTTKTESSTHTLSVASTTKTESSTQSTSTLTLVSSTTTTSTTSSTSKINFFYEIYFVDFLKIQISNNFEGNQTLESLEGFRILSSEQKALIYSNLYSNLTNDIDYAFQNVFGDLFENLTIYSIKPNLEL